VAAVIPVHPVLAVACGTVVLLVVVTALGALPEEFVHALRRRPGG